MTLGWRQTRRPHRVSPGSGTPAGRFSPYPAPVCTITDYPAPVCTITDYPAPVRTITDYPALVCTITGSTALSVLSLERLSGQFKEEPEQTGWKSVFSGTSSESYFQLLTPPPTPLGVKPRGKSSECCGFQGPRFSALRFVLPPPRGAPGFHCLAPRVPGDQDACAPPPGPGGRRLGGAVFTSEWPHFSQIRKPGARTGSRRFYI